MPRPAYRIHHERSLDGSCLRLCDAACVAVGFIAATLSPSVTVESRYLLAGAVAIIVVLLVGELVGLYRGWRGVALHREIAVAQLTWLYSLAILLGIGFLTRYTDLGSPRWPGHRGGYRFVPFRGLAGDVSWFAEDSAQQRLQFAENRHRRSQRIGDSPGTEHGGTPELGMQLAGFYDDRPSKRTGELPEDVGHRLGSIDDLVSAARRGEVHRVYITLPLRAEKRIRSVLNRLADTTASVYIVPDFFVFELLHSRWTDINGLPS